MHKRLVVVSAILVIFAAACSGEEDSAQTMPASDSPPAPEHSQTQDGEDPDQALITFLTEDIAADPQFPSGGDAQCLATEMVNGLGGAERLDTEYGITTETERVASVLRVPVDEARVIADGFLNCGFREMFVENLEYHSGYSGGRRSLRCRTLRRIRCA